ncbi:MAG: 50S ribosomal protein L9 [Candidatus Methylomirabilales bacterium]
MKVILVQEVAKLGRAGSQVDVARGYARNYLIPQKLAVEASESNVRALEQFQAEGRKREKRIQGEAEALATKLQGVRLTIVRQAGEQERLFGSVTNIDIADALAAQGINLDRKKILLTEPIKTLGSFSVPVRLHPEVTAEVQGLVVTG